VNDNLRDTQATSSASRDSDKGDFRLELVDRLHLNAAIERLIESKGSCDESRRTVYEFGSRLRPLSRVSGSLQMQSPGDTFSGNTPEHGNVQLTDDEEVRSFAFGRVRERVGHYKIWREREGRRRHKVVVAHFWKLDEGTESTAEEPQVWCISCGKDGPSWFGERASRTVWTFGFNLCRHEFIEQWGAHIGKRHHAGWSIELVL
jgi:hypothetical protein